MTHDEHVIVDVWRCLNIVLSTVTLTVLLVDLPWRRWTRLPARIQLFTQAVALMLVRDIVDPVESIMRHGPFGWRVPLSTVATMWLLYALLFTNQVKFYDGGSDVGVEEEEDK